MEQDLRDDLLIELMAKIAESLSLIAERMPAKPGDFATLWSADEPTPQVTKRGKPTKAVPVIKHENVYDFLLTIDYLTVLESDSVTEAYAKWLAAMRLGACYYPAMTASVLFARLGLGRPELAKSNLKAVLRNEILQKALKYAAVRTNDSAQNKEALHNEATWPYTVHGPSNTIRVSKNFDSCISASKPELRDLFNALYARAKKDAEATHWLVKVEQTLLD